MNRQQKRSLTRKAIKEMKKAKPTKVKKIDDAFDKKIEAIKNKRNETVKKLPIYKKILGIAFLPVMFLLFSIDRFIHLFLPHATHASFTLYLIEPSSLKLTFIRIAMVSGIIILFCLFCHMCLSLPFLLTSLVCKP